MKRILASLLSLSLIVTSGGIAEAALAAPGAFALPSDLPQFRLQPPQKLGRVTDYFNARDSVMPPVRQSDPSSRNSGISESRPLVILIQDLHAHYGAQKNIAGLLEFIQSRLRDAAMPPVRSWNPSSRNSGISEYPAFVVAVEGASGPIDHTILAKFPDRQVAVAAADFLMKEAEITGAEFFAVKTQQPKLLTGVENQEYYNVHRDVFVKTHADREKLVHELQTIQAQIERLPRKLYTRPLIQIHRLQKAHEAGKISTQEFVQRLLTFVESRELGVGSNNKVSPAPTPHALLKDFPALARFTANASVSMTPDQMRASVVSFLQEAHPRFSGEERKNLEILGKGKEAHPYFLYLRELIHKHKLFLAVPPALAQHLEYIHTVESLGMDRVLFEAQELAFRIKLETARREERGVRRDETNDPSSPLTPPSSPLLNLIQVQHDLDLLLRVADLKATENEVRAFGPRFNAFLAMTEALLQTAKSEEGGAKRDTSGQSMSLLSPRSTPLDIRRLISASIDYYTLAMMRNEPMVENTLNLTTARREEGGVKSDTTNRPSSLLTPRPASVAVLVAGGFHTSPITQILREKNISYLVITPMINHVDDLDHALYVKRLLGQHLTDAEILAKAGTARQSSGGLSPVLTKLRSLLPQKDHALQAPITANTKLILATLLAVGAAMATVSVAEYFPEFQQKLSALIYQAPGVLEWVQSNPVKALTAAAPVVAATVALSGRGSDRDTPDLWSRKSVLPETFKKIGQIKSRNTATQKPDIYQDTLTEQKFLIKKGSEHTLRADLIGQRLFQKAGFRVPKARLTRIEGELVLLVEYLEGLTESDENQLPEGFEKNPEIQAAFLLDLLLFNYDRTPWNMLYDLALKQPVFIDFGASLLSRAQGKHKGFPEEIDQTQIDLIYKNNPLDKGTPVNAAYENLMTQKGPALAVSLIRLTEISESDMDTIVEEAYAGVSEEADRAYLADMASQSDEVNSPFPSARANAQLILDKWKGSSKAYLKHALKSRRSSVVNWAVKQSITSKTPSIEEYLKPLNVPAWTKFTLFLPKVADFPIKHFGLWAEALSKEFWELLKVDDPSARLSTHPPVNSMDVTDPYLDGLSDNKQMMSDQELLDQMEAEHARLAARHPDAKGPLTQSKIKMRAFLGSDTYKRIAIVARIMAAVVAKIRSSDPDRFIVYFARDIAFNLAIENTLDRMDGRGPPRSSGFYLNTPMMGSVYGELNNLLHEPKAQGPNLESTIEKWFAFRMQDPAFAELAEKARSSLAESGVFKQEKVLLMDTGYAATMPWFIFGLMRYYDQKAKRPKRDIQILLVKSNNRTPELSPEHTGERERELFNQRTSFRDIWTDNSTMAHILEGLGYARQHPIQFNQATRSIEAETPEHQLEFFLIRLLFQNMALAQHFQEAGVNELKDKDISDLAAKYALAIPSWDQKKVLLELTMKDFSKTYDAISHLDKELLKRKPDSYTPPKILLDYKLPEDFFKGPELNPFNFADYQIKSIKPEFEQLSIHKKILLKPMNFWDHFLWLLGSGMPLPAALLLTLEPLFKGPGAILTRLSKFMVSAFKIGFALWLAMLAGTPEAQQFLFFAVLAMGLFAFGHAIHGLITFIRPANDVAPGTPSEGIPVFEGFLMELQKPGETAAAAKSVAAKHHESNLAAAGRKHAPGVRTLLENAPVDNAVKEKAAQWLAAAVEHWSIDEAAALLQLLAHPLMDAEGEALIEEFLDKPGLAALVEKAAENEEMAKGAFGELAAAHAMLHDGVLPYEIDLLHLGKSFHDEENSPIAELDGFVIDKRSGRLKGVEVKDLALPHDTYHPVSKWIVGLKDQIDHKAALLKKLIRHAGELQVTGIPNDLNLANIETLIFAIQDVLPEDQRKIVEQEIQAHVDALNARLARRSSASSRAPAPRIKVRIVFFNGHNPFSKPLNAAVTNAAAFQQIKAGISKLKDDFLSAQKKAEAELQLKFAKRLKAGPGKAQALVEYVLRRTNRDVAKASEVLDRLLDLHESDIKQSLMSKSMDFKGDTIERRMEKIAGMLHNLSPHLQVPAPLQKQLGLPSPAVELVGRTVRDALLHMTADNADARKTLFDNDGALRSSFGVYDAFTKEVPLDSPLDGIHSLFILPRIIGGVDVTLGPRSAADQPTTKTPASRVTPVSPVQPTGDSARKQQEDGGDRADLSQTASDVLQFETARELIVTELSTYAGKRFGTPPKLPGEMQERAFWESLLTRKGLTKIDQSPVKELMGSLITLLNPKDESQSKTHLFINSVLANLPKSPAEPVSQGSAGIKTIALGLLALGGLRLQAATPFDAEIETFRTAAPLALHAGTEYLIGAGMVVALSLCLAYLIVVGRNKPTFAASDDIFNLHAETDSHADRALERQARKQKPGSRWTLADYAIALFAIFMSVLAAWLLGPDLLDVLRSFAQQQWPGAFDALAQSLNVIHISGFTGIETEQPFETAGYGIVALQSLMNGGTPVLLSASPAVVKNEADDANAAGDEFRKTLVIMRSPWMEKLEQDNLSLKESEQFSPKRMESLATQIAFGQWLAQASPDEILAQAQPWAEVLLPFEKSLIRNELAEELLTTWNIYLHKPQQENTRTQAIEKLNTILSLFISPTPKEDVVITSEEQLLELDPAIAGSIIARADMRSSLVVVGFNSVTKKRFISHFRSLGHLDISVGTDVQESRLKSDYLGRVLPHHLLNEEKDSWTVRVLDAAHQLSGAQGKRRISTQDVVAHLQRTNKASPEQIRAWHVTQRSVYFLPDGTLGSNAIVPQTLSLVPVAPGQFVILSSLQGGAGLATAGSDHVLVSVQSDRKQNRIAGLASFKMDSLDKATVDLFARALLERFLDIGTKHRAPLIVRLIHPQSMNQDELQKFKAALLGIFTEYRFHLQGELTMVGHSGGMSIELHPDRGLKPIRGRLQSASEQAEAIRHIVEQIDGRLNPHPQTVSLGSVSRRVNVAVRLSTGDGPVHKMRLWAESPRDLLSHPLVREKLEGRQVVVLVNGKKVELHQLQQLKSGDEVWVGPIAGGVDESRKNSGTPIPTVVKRVLPILAFGYLANLFSGVVKGYELVLGANGQVTGVRVEDGDTMGTIVQGLQNKGVVDAGPLWGNDGTVQSVWSALESLANRPFGQIFSGETLSLHGLAEPVRVMTGSQQLPSYEVMMDATSWAQALGPWVPFALIGGAIFLITVILAMRYAPVPDIRSIFYTSSQPAQSSPSIVSQTTAPHRGTTNRRRFLENTGALLLGLIPFTQGKAQESSAPWLVPMQDSWAIAVTVLIPAQIRSYFGEQAQISVSARSTREALEKLIQTATEQNRDKVRDFFIDKQTKKLKFVLTDGNTLFPADATLPGGNLRLIPSIAGGVNTRISEVFAPNTEGGSGGSYGPSSVFDSLSGQATIQDKYVTIAKEDFLILERALLKAKQYSSEWNSRDLIKMRIDPTLTASGAHRQAYRLLDAVARLRGYYGFDHLAAWAFEVPFATPPALVQRYPTYLDIVYETLWREGWVNEAITEGAADSRVSALNELRNNPNAHPEAKTWLNALLYALNPANGSQDIASYRSGRPLNNPLIVLDDRTASYERVKLRKDESGLTLAVAMDPFERVADRNPGQQSVTSMSKVSLDQNHNEYWIHDGTLALRVQRRGMSLYYQRFMISDEHVIALDHQWKELLTQTTENPDQFDSTLWLFSDSGVAPMGKFTMTGLALILQFIYDEENDVFLIQAHPNFASTKKRIIHFDQIDQNSPLLPPFALFDSPLTDPQTRWTRPRENEARIIDLLLGGKRYGIVISVDPKNQLWVIDRSRPARRFGPILPTSTEPITIGRASLDEGSLPDIPLFNVPADISRRALQIRFDDSTSKWQINKHPAAKVQTLEGTQLGLGWIDINQLVSTHQSWWNLSSSLFSNAEKISISSPNSIVWHALQAERARDPNSWVSRTIPKEWDRPIGLAGAVMEWAWAAAAGLGFAALVSPAAGVLVMMAILGSITLTEIQLRNALLSRARGRPMTPKELAGFLAPKILAWLFYIPLLSQLDSPAIVQIPNAVIAAVAHLAFDAFAMSRNRPAEALATAPPKGPSLKQLLRGDLPEGVDPISRLAEEFKLVLGYGWWLSDTWVKVSKHHAEMKRAGKVELHRKKYQGYKFHISLDSRDPEEAERILRVLIPFLESYGLPFKVVWNLSLLEKRSNIQRQKGMAIFLSQEKYEEIEKKLTAAGFQPPVNNGRVLNAAALALGSRLEQLLLRAGVSSPPDDLVFGPDGDRGDKLFVPPSGISTGRVGYRVGTIVDEPVKVNGRLLPDVRGRYAYPDWVQTAHLPSPGLASPSVPPSVTRPEPRTMDLSTARNTSTLSDLLKQLSGRIYSGELTEARHVLLTMKNYCVTEGYSGIPFWALSLPARESLFQRLTISNEWLSLIPALESVFHDFSPKAALQTREQSLTAYQLQQIQDIASNNDEFKKQLLLSATRTIPTDEISLETIRHALAIRRTSPKFFATQYPTVEEVFVWLQVDPSSNSEGLTHNERRLVSWIQKEARHSGRSPLLNLSVDTLDGAIEISRELRYKTQQLELEAMPKARVLAYEILRVMIIQQRLDALNPGNDPIEEDAIISRTLETIERLLPPDLSSLKNRHLGAFLDDVHSARLHQAHRAAQTDLGAASREMHRVRLNRINSFFKITIEEQDSNQKPLFDEASGRLIVSSRVGKAENELENLAAQYAIQYFDLPSYWRNASEDIIQQLYAASRGAATFAALSTDQRRIFSAQRNNPNNIHGILKEALLSRFNHPRQFRKHFPEADAMLGGIFTPNRPAVSIPDSLKESLRRQPKTQPVQQTGRLDSMLKFDYWPKLPFFVIFGIFEGNFVHEPGHAGVASAMHFTVDEIEYWIDPHVTIQEWESDLNLKDFAGTASTYRAAFATSLGGIALNLFLGAALLGWTVFLLYHGHTVWAIVVGRWALGQLVTGIFNIFGNDGKQALHFLSKSFEYSGLIKSKGSQSPGFSDLKEARISISQYDQDKKQIHELGGPTASQKTARLKRKVSESTANRLWWWQRWTIRQGFYPGDIPSNRFDSSGPGRFDSPGFSNGSPVAEDLLNRASAQPQNIDRGTANEQFTITHGLASKSQYLASADIQPENLSYGTTGLRNAKATDRPVSLEIDEADSRGPIFLVSRTKSGTQASVRLGKLRNSNRLVALVVYPILPEQTFDDHDHLISKQERAAIAADALGLLRYHGRTEDTYGETALVFDVIPGDNPMVAAGMGWITPGTVMKFIELQGRLIRAGLHDQDLQIHIDRNGHIGLIDPDTLTNSSGEVASYQSHDFNKRMDFLLRALMEKGRDQLLTALAQIHAHQDGKMILDSLNKWLGSNSHTSEQNELNRVLRDYHPTAASPRWWSRLFMAEGMVAIIASYLSLRWILLSLLQHPFEALGGIAVLSAIAYFIATQRHTLMPHIKHWLNPQRQSQKGIVLVGRAAEARAAESGTGKFSSMLEPKMEAIAASHRKDLISEHRAAFLRNA